MSMSVFEIIGPPMVGPSSSHTAGACRIGWLARAILGEAALSAVFRLHGSFAATGAGHGTAEALLAGLLAMRPDDERLKDAVALAREAGLQVGFEEIDLGPQAHPNSVVVEACGKTSRISLVASSVGGGSILATEIDGLPVHLCGTLETLVLWHRDTPGFLARVTGVLACLEINVASIQTGRRQRGHEALTSVEMDSSLPPEIWSLFSKAPAISRLVVIPKLPGY